MNYYDARKRSSDNRWDYTCMNDGHVWPVGYCRPWQPLTCPPLSEAYVNDPHQQKKHAEFKDKHHDDGHATEQEARECYRQYLLDKKLVLDRKLIDLQRKCAVCETWTQGCAEVGLHLFVLCDDHRTRGQVEKLMPLPGPVTSSM